MVVVRLIVNAGSSAVSIPLQPSRLGALDSQRDLWEANRPVRGYADPGGSRLAFDFVRRTGTSDGSFSDDAGCSVTVTGYLIDP